MSLQDRLEDWRDPRNYDKPPSEEEALRQFLFVAISHFIEEHDQSLVDWLISSDDDEIPDLNDWVDAYAERSLSEPNGYDRA